MAEALPPSERILILLGYYRDDMPAAAVKAFQKLADDLRETASGRRG